VLLSWGASESRSRKFRDRLHVIVDGGSVSYVGITKYEARRPVSHDRVIEQKPSLARSNQCRRIRGEDKLNQVYD